MLTYLFRKQRSESFEFADITFVECEQQLLNPLVGSVVERVEDGMHELWSRTSQHISVKDVQMGKKRSAHQFPEVVDRVAKEGGNSQVVRAKYTFLRRQVLRRVDACEVEE